MELVANRWWVYQRERFPLLGHGPLIAAFSFSAVAYSALLRGATGLASATGWVVAFITSLAFFLQLRIADEFKDFEEDSLYRPYRPVPRGLVKLWELGIAGAVLAAIQLALALWFFKPLVWLLLATWIHLAMMSREFFMREWLKRRPITYMWTHMLIMPLIDFYATACDWLVNAGSLAVHSVPLGLQWFLVVSFFNGIVIEIGRKIRAPADEEHGVETYSVLWGSGRAVAVWLGALAVTAVGALLAAREIGFVGPVAAVLALFLFSAALAARGFLREPAAGSGKRFEKLAGLWTVGMYLSLGAGPLLWRA
jgi:4-hydroxybenzoate polyprenyltransferase